MIQSLLKFLGGGAAEQIGQYFADKQKLKQQLTLAKLQGKIDVEAAKAKAAIMREENTHTWEMAQIANSGYKDEIVLGVLLYPYIGSFIPGIQDSVLVGFEYLEQMPYWAVGLTVTIFLAIYGIRHKNASRISAPGLKDSDVEGVK